jgi:hypothetical protein
MYESAFSNRKTPNLVLNSQVRVVHNPNDLDMGNPGKKPVNVQRRAFWTVARDPLKTQHIATIGMLLGA